MNSEKCIITSHYKPPRRFAPCRLDFDTLLSSIATLPQSPLPSRPHSWLPSTNPPYFTLASLHFLSSPYFLPLPFFPPSPPRLPSIPLPTPIYTPIICPYSCYVGLYCTISSYTGFAIRDDVMPYTAATHDAIIIVSSCYVIVTGAPLIC